MPELDKKSIATSKAESSTCCVEIWRNFSVLILDTAGKQPKHCAILLFLCTKKRTQRWWLTGICLDSDALWSCGSRSIVISDWCKRWAMHSKWLHLTPCDSYGSPSGEYRWRSALIGSPGRRSAQQHPTFGSLTTQSPFWDLMGQNLARNGRSDKNGQNLWSQATKSD